MDPSEEKLGLEDIDGNGVGGVDEVEDRIVFRKLLENPRDAGL